ncbi:MAG: ester cyclase [Chromatiales bacterium]|nr:MAG: ester cyclase [Chromatiales bacterium]
MESPPAWRELTEGTRARMHEMDEIIRDRDQARSYRNYLAIFADDVVAHGLLESGDTGIDGLREHYRPVFFELKDGVLLSDEVIVAGNMAAQRYHSMLYLAGEFDGVAGQSQPVFLRGQTFFRFDDDGRIAERWSNHDHGYRLGQLLGPQGRAEGDRIARELNGPGLSEAEIHARLEGLTHAFNRMEAPAERDREFFGVFDKNVRVHGLDNVPAGLADLQQQLRELWTAVPDLRLTVNAPLSAWSMGAFRWRALGSQRKLYRDREPDLRPVSLQGECILRFNNQGRIVEIWLNTAPIEFDHAH